MIIYMINYIKAIDAIHYILMKREFQLVCIYTVLCRQGNLYILKIIECNIIESFMLKDSMLYTTTACIIPKLESLGQCFEKSYTEMEGTICKHELMEEGNYIVCKKCSKYKKLRKVEVNQYISQGQRSSTKYTVRTNRDRVFYPQEWKNFFDNLKESQKFTFYTLLITGARIMEVQHIKPEWIDDTNQRVALQKTKQRADSLGNKKSKTRTIRICKKLCRMFKDREDKLKPDGTFKILATSSANIAMKKALKKAKIKDWQMFSVHSIRKTAETWALALGIDSMKLSKRFGHNLMTAYQHYSQSDAYTFKEKDIMKQILGDTYEQM